MRSFIATHNLIAVSAALRETAINTEQTLSASMLCAVSDIMNVEPRREDNGNEAIGKEEADAIYDNGSLALFPMTFEKAQPQHFAFMLAYALGQIASAAAGTGYQHTITPIVGDLDYSRSNPSFTAGGRLGLTIFKRRLASCFMDSFTATFARDGWVKLAGQVKATGKQTTNIVSETISAQKNAASISLAANAVQGADAPTRLDNVHQIKVELAAGVWTEVAYSAVSNATPAVITITPPAGVAGAVNYKVLYVPAESAWMTFPARIVETPLRVSQLSLNVGGSWDGSAFTGGRALSSEVKSLEYSFNNNGEIQFPPGAGGAYGGRYIRNGRTQKIKLDREMREYILQQHIIDNDTFGIYVLAEGAIYDGAHKYQVELIFPKCSLITAPISVDGKRLAEAGDIQPLEDTTYGSVIAKVKNLQAAYAA